MDVQRVCARAQGGLADPTAPGWSLAESQEPRHSCHALYTIRKLDGASHVIDPWHLGFDARGRCITWGCPSARVKFATPFKARAPGQVGEGVSSHVHRVLDLWLDQACATSTRSISSQLPRTVPLKVSKPCQNPSCLTLADRLWSKAKRKKPQPRPDVLDALSALDTTFNQSPRSQTVHDGTTSLIRPY